MKDVSEAGEYLDKDNIACKLAMVKLLRWFVNSMAIADAAKKHHEYIVRQQKPISEEQKEINARNSRILQRRQRVRIALHVLPVLIHKFYSIIIHYCSYLIGVSSLQEEEKWELCNPLVRSICLMKSQTLKIPKLSLSDLPVGEVKNSLNSCKSSMSAMPARGKRRTIRSL